jgi:glutamine amidotransferase
VCRHLAYLGPACPLSALVLEPEFGLLRQSYAPKDMRGGGTINADGFGVGWYPSGRRPVRYRTDRPLWSDRAFAELAEVTESGAVLAAIRSATVGMPVISTASAPFTDGHWLFSHNGVVPGWPDSVAGLAERLPVTDLLTLDAPTDSALLWALVQQRLRAGQPAERALARVVAEVARAAPGAKLNLLLTDGSRVYATAWRHALCYRLGPDSVLVASEPHDELPGWTSVADGWLLTGQPGRVHAVAIAPDSDLAEVAELSEAGVHNPAANRGDNKGA